MTTIAKKDVARSHRALELAVHDWSLKDHSKDEDLAQEWGVSATVITDLRRSDAYREAIMDLQDKAISYLGEQIGDVQSTALSYLRDLIPKIAKAANSIFVPPDDAPDDWAPNTRSLNTATNIAKVLYEFSGIKEGSQLPANNRPVQQILPNLRIAKSNTEVIQEMRVRVTRTYETPAVIEDGETIDME